jgi:tetratricopeptide (TPR) repeat protein
VTTLEAAGRTPDLAFGQVLAVICECWQGRRAIERLRDSLAIYESRGDRWGTALTLEVLGFELIEHDRPGAQACAQRSLALRRQIGDQWGVSLALFLLASIAEAKGLHHVAKQRFRESLQLRRRTGEGPGGAILCLEGMGRAARRMGNFDEARRLYRGALPSSRKYGLHLCEPRLLMNLTHVLDELQAHEEACTLVEQALAIYQTHGDEYGAMTAQALAGIVNLAAGKRDEARAALEGIAHLSPPAGGAVAGQSAWPPLGRALLAMLDGAGDAAKRQLRAAMACAIRQHDHPLQIRLLLEMADLELQRGDPVAALGIIGTVQDHPCASPLQRTRLEQLLHGAAETVPRDQLEAALARGRGRDVATLAGIVAGAAGGVCAGAAGDRTESGDCP